MSDKIYILKDKKSIFDQRVLITANFASVKLEEVELEPGKGTKTDEFKKISPKQTCPALLTKNGSIWSSCAIQRYFSKSKKSLYGNSSFEEAHQDCLLEWIDSDLVSTVGPLARNLAGFFINKTNKT
jgi:glutathione S-transferase